MDAAYVFANVCGHRKNWHFTLAFMRIMRIPSMPALSLSRYTEIVKGNQHFWMQYDWCFSFSRSQPYFIMFQLVRKNISIEFLNCWPTSDMIQLVSSPVIGTSCKAIPRKFHWFVFNFDFFFYLSKTVLVFQHDIKRYETKWTKVFILNMISIDFCFFSQTFKFQDRVRRIAQSRWFG